MKKKVTLIIFDSKNQKNKKGFHMTYLCVHELLH